MADWERKPHKFLDYLIKTHKFKNDAALARALGFKSPMISKIRSRKSSIGPNFILAIHEELGVPIKEIKAMIAESKE